MKVHWQAARLVAAVALLIVHGEALDFAAQDVVLEPGRKIEAQIVKDAVHRYRVPLAAGQYAHVLIEASHEIRQRLRRNDGWSLDGLVRHSFRTSGRPDRIVLVAEDDAEYTIELIGLMPVSYTIDIRVAGALTPAEHTRFEAQRLLSGPGHPSEEGWVDERRAQLQQSREMFRELRDVDAEIDAVMRLGYSQAYRDWPAARHHFLDAFEVARRTGRPLSEREALNNLGVTLNNMGDARQSAEYLMQAFAAARRHDPGYSDFNLVHNLAISYAGLGEYQLALRYAREALAAEEKTSAGAANGYPAMNLGNIHLVLGDDETALSYYALALERFRAAKHATGTARTLVGIGMLRARGNDHRGAIENYREAIPLWREAKDLLGEAGAHSRLGMALSAIGSTTEAAAAYQRALTLSRQSGTRLVEAEALRALGDLRRAENAHSESAALLSEALEIARAVEDRVGEAATRLSLARLFRDRQQLTTAREHIERALDLIESVRTAVANPDLRASFAATKRDYYDVYIDLLMRLHRQEPSAGHDAAALQVSERSHARSLVETLTEAGADIRDGAPSSLLGRERVLQNDVTGKAARLATVLAGSASAADVAKAHADLRQTAAEFEDVQARIRQESPRFAALTQPQPLGAASIQQRVLDERTALIEYALGAERSYAWVVTKRGLWSYELPKRDLIEAAAREAYERVAASGQRQAWGQAERATTRLAQLILSPLARNLGHARLVIVPDGALHYVPFAALPRPGTTTPLIVSHELVTLPSASALDAIRRESKGRKAGSRAAALFADPVLDATDGRVNGARADNSRAAEQRADLLRSARESGLPRFGRLAFTRDEADAIAQVAGSANVMYAVDFNASRATALSARLADYRIIHFATHGLINSAHPRLSGLVLSLVDKRGEPQDGFVRLHDIYNMKLNAALVVLSACRTALGKDIRGEGLVGLTRGFMYAGAPSVVASLWDVRDRATAELMKRFYARMLSDGQAPAAALRAAQISMLNEPRWQSPFNWAGFIMQGDWTALP